MFKKIALLLCIIAALAASVALYRYEETRELSGMVRDAETRTPIEGGRITLAGYQTTSDGAGRYTISVPRGKYGITATADGYASAKSEINGEEFFKHAFAVDFELPLNQVNGEVRDAETNQPLAYAQVTVGEKVMSADGKGVFQLRGVKSGWVIAAGAPGYKTQAFTLDGKTAEIAIALVPNAVAVQLTDQYTRQPIPNAQVQAGVQSLSTDKNGIAILRRVAPGAALRASAPGYESASASLNSNDLALALRPTTLDGNVTDAGTGQPISGTLVYLGGQIAVTNSKGAYHFDNIPAKAAITVRAPGYRKMQIEVGATVRRDVKMPPFLAKAIHIPMGLPAERVRELMEMVSKTELNAIVLDVKSERGYIAWDSAAPLAKQIGAASGRSADLAEVIQRCRAQNIYCIARLAVFQDSLLATERPALAIRYANGRLYTENGGAAWTNPTSAEVWDHNIALAKEIAALGFDEIQFDYVRFPGFVEGLYYGDRASEEARVAAIAGFLSRAQKELRASGVFVSADVFGLTTATDDDQYTGQRLRDVGAYLDYVSPMVYPDTWADSPYLVTNGLGVRNCRDAVQCPYDIIYNTYKRAAEKTPTKVRLWLQAYPGRGDYGIAQYKLQKKAAQDAGSWGWMFWNQQGNYDVRMFGPPGE